MGEDRLCSEERKCCCVEKHQGHICTLKRKGMTRRIGQLTSAPNIVCFDCGEEANSGDDVCSPMPLFV